MTSAFLKPRVTVGGKSYSVLNEIAEGALGVVHRVKSVNMATLGQHFAMKKMTCQDADQVAAARKEINLMKLLAHPNLVPLVDSELTETRPGMVIVQMLMPYYPTSLQAVLEEGAYPLCAFVDGLWVLTILHNVADGLEHMHSRGYRHADLKPGNILLLTQGHQQQAVLADFGSACPLVVRCASRQQALVIQEDAAMATTAPYRAPELWDTPNECIIDGKADVWSFGSTLYATLFSRCPFEPPGQPFSSLAVLSGSYRFPAAHTWASDYLDVVSGCLTVDTTARLGLQEVQQRLKRLPTNNNLKSQGQVLAAAAQQPAAPPVSLEGALPTLPPPLPPRVKPGKVEKEANSAFAFAANFDEPQHTPSAFADFSEVCLPPTQQAAQEVDDEFGDFIG